MRAPAPLLLPILLLLGPTALVPAAAELVEVAGAGGGRGMNSPAGDAEPGEPGEDADALADASDPSNTAHAVGGQGGDGGSTLAASGADGGDGGAGGSARAEARSDQVGDASASTRAFGGWGGSGGSGAPQGGGMDGVGGRGGDAHAVASARSELGDASAGGVARAGPGSVGGDAFVSGEATSDTGSALVSVEAYGGGGSIGGRSSAEGFAAGTDEVYVSLYAVGGRGGGSANATGTLAGTGEALHVVRAIGGVGGGAAAASASTLGAGGRARVVAEGGVGAEANGDELLPNDGGDAFASADVEGPGDVSVEAIAQGGAGGPVGFGSIPAGTGGIPTLGLVSGRSTNGGSVLVTGRVIGGAGGARRAEAGGNGASAHAENAVAGDTAGDLTLQQLVEGGAAGRHPQGLPGHAGDASSTLEFAGDSASLSLEVEARAGADARGDGAEGVVRVDASNLAGTLDVVGTAFGGGSLMSDPATGTGNGGHAQVEIVGETWGDGHAIQIGRDPVDLRAYGASAGRSESHDGGDATSMSRGIAHGDAEVLVVDVASGGSSAGVGAMGGRASSSAYGSNAGASDVEVSAIAQGGRGEQGGVAAASAHGESSGGGDVTVRVRQVGGEGVLVGTGNGDSIAEDAATGSTTGRLRLVQEAIGGGAGAEVRSVLRPVRAQGDLAVHALSFNDGGSSADQSSLAEAVASDDAGNALFVHAAAAGARPELGDVSAVSTAGGDVTVVAGVEIVDSFEPAQRDIELRNVATAETTGRLTIVQSAVAATFPDGEEGRATSVLERMGRHEALRLSSLAEGGPAFASADGRNETGDAHAQASAWSRGAHDARAEAIARGVRDGARVTVGTDADPVNASVQDADFVFANPIVGSGAFASAGVAGAGDATSRSEGIHEGDGEVVVRDRAFATKGVWRTRQGGNAHSTAIGASAGFALVDVRSEAGGGSTERTDRRESTDRLLLPRRGGALALDDGFGGDARSEAWASGLGEVRAEAIAHAGLGGVRNGDAEALAQAIGSSGFVAAQAVADTADPRRSFSQHQLGVVARASVASSAGAWAVLSDGPVTDEMRLVANGLDAYALAQGMQRSLAPEASPGPGTDVGDVAARLSRVLTVVEAGGRNLQGEAFRLEHEFAVGLPRRYGSSYLEPERLSSDEVHIGFLDADIEGEIERLALRVEVAGVLIEKQHFGDTSTALAYLDDLVISFDAQDPRIELGPGALPTLAILDVSLDLVTSDPGASTHFAFFVGTVPEPMGTLLVVIGVLAMCRRRRSG